jgi:hypothetical protein
VEAKNMNIGEKIVTKQEIVQVNIKGTDASGYALKSDQPNEAEQLIIERDPTNDTWYPAYSIGEMDAKTLKSKIGIWQDVNNNNIMDEGEVKSINDIWKWSQSITEGEEQELEGGKPTGFKYICRSKMTDIRILAEGEKLFLVQEKKIFSKAKQGHKVK